MSRTTRCLFALGLSVSLAMACGDDDDDGFGGGGGGGRAGSGGRAGAAGAGGDAGAAGSGGDAGSSGSGGSGNGGASNGGTGGTGGSGNGGSGNAGTGGSSQEPPDAGPDAAPDGGEEPIGDAGPEPIACPDFEEATAGAASSESTQVIIFSRLAFVGPDAQGCDDPNGCIEVTFRALEDGFVFASPLLLCTGSEENGDCDDGVQNLEGSGVGDAGTALVEGEELTFVTGLGLVTPAAGELALINGQPGQGDPIVRAYINWGGYVSLPAPGGGETLEQAAVEEGLNGVWFEGDSVEVNGQTTIYATGDVTIEDDFQVCTQVP